MARTREGGSAEQRGHKLDKKQNAERTEGKAVTLYRTGEEEQWRAVPTTGVEMVAGGKDGSRPAAGCTRVFGLEKEREPLQKRKLRSVRQGKNLTTPRSCRELRRPNTCPGSQSGEAEEGLDITDI